MNLPVLFKQFLQIADVLGYLGGVGLVYYVVRGRHHLKTPRTYLISVAAVIGALILTFSYFGRAAERYYRPLGPALFVLAGGGFYSLYEDLKHRKLICGVLAALIVCACLGISLREPLRAHRAPQTRAGRWLRQYDPAYSGFVLSSYHQPVFYAGMRYLPTDEPYSEKAYRQLVEAGYAPKYLIVDGSDLSDLPWMQRLLDSGDWQEIHSESERNIRIYECRTAGHGSRNERPLTEPQDGNIQRR